MYAFGVVAWEISMCKFLFKVVIVAVVIIGAVVAAWRAGQWPLDYN